jgi:hypothetical protein
LLGAGPGEQRVREPRFALEILERATAELRKLDQDPVQFYVSITDHLEPVDKSVLRERNVDDLSGIWSVNFWPGNKPGHAVAGGEFVWYFRFPSPNPIAVWFAE